jgi:23S rRNA pseudouridine1911/1915/1917 synthase
MSKDSSKNSFPEIPIIYEDRDILAINKPPGLIVHPDGKTKELVLTDWILEKYPETKDVGEPIKLTSGDVIDRPGIVHRLDRFQARTISKKYYAFVYGMLKDKYGIINQPIGRSSKDFRQWTSGPKVRGELRPAETWYTLIGSKDGYSIVEAEPRTGRTHQIRVHFKFIGHPVICDKLYALGKPEALGFSRTALHAGIIEFNDMRGKKIKISAPFPDDFLKASSEIRIDLPKI